MRILACLKQIREPETVFDLEGGRAVWRGQAMRRLGTLDEFALEEALRLKDRDPAHEVCAVTLGPPHAEDVLRRALGMGADRAVRLEGPDQPPPRPGNVAKAIAGWAAGEGFDLILAGVMSEDAMQGLVGPMLAAELGMAWATSVVEIKTEGDGCGIEAAREMEGGRRQRLWLPLPALLTIQSGLNKPRYPRLTRMLAAKKAAISVIADEEPAPAKEALDSLSWPGRTRAGLVLEGSTRDKALRLGEILRERALL